MGPKQPLTIRDFMNYLLYKEHSAENLQFYLWHQDYVDRFSKAPASERSLAPEWTQAKEDEVWTQLQQEAHEHARKTPDVAKCVFEGTDFETTATVDRPVALESANPFATPPRTATSGSEHDSMYPPSTQASYGTTYRSQAGEAFAAAGVKAPCKFSDPPHYRKEAGD
jgi:hypothetical protein